jgi:hypothetical protein
MFAVCAWTQIAVIHCFCKTSFAKCMTLRSQKANLHSQIANSEPLIQTLTLTPMGHSRKHPYHPHRGNRKLTPLPHSDVLIHLLLSETIFSPLLLRTAEISSVGGVWIFSGTTQFQNLFYSFLSFLLYLSNICVSVLV